MINHVLNVDGFYFSTTYDLTHTLQRLSNTSPEFQEMSLLERVSFIFSDFYSFFFFWGPYLCVIHKNTYGFLAVLATSDTRVGLTPHHDLSSVTIASSGSQNVYVWPRQDWEPVVWEFGNPVWTDMLVVSWLSVFCCMTVININNIIILIKWMYVPAGSILSALVLFIVSATGKVRTYWCKNLTNIDLFKVGFFCYFTFPPYECIFKTRSQMISS